jgi:hypothetical protein
MANTTFTDGVTLTDDEWFNHVNDAVYEVIGDGTIPPTTAVAAMKNLFKKGANIASAATVNLAAATGNYVHITGTTTITSLGTVNAGVPFMLVFDEALTLTYNATSMILIGGTSRTTVAGDVSIVVSEGAGNWKEISYSNPSRIITTPLAHKLASGTVSAVATLDIVMTAYTAYPNKLLILDSFIPATDSSALYGRVSTDGGSTFDSGAGTYRYAKKQQSSSPASTDTGGTDAAIVIATAVGNGAGEPGCSAEIQMWNTTRTSTNGLFISKATFNDGVPNTVIQLNSVERTANQDTDAFRVLFSAGNIASGTWALYGYN